MGRRILNRKDLRDQFDAAERRKGDDEEGEEEGEEEEEDDDAEASEDGEGAEEGEEGEAEAEGDGEGEEEEVPVKKKAKKKAAPKEPKPKRTRAAKIVRQRVVWGVFNNSNQRVATYPYPEKTKAEEHAARLKAESKTSQTHFVQPVKEPIEEEKKEK